MFKLLKKQKAFTDIIFQIYTLTTTKPRL